MSNKIEIARKLKYLIERADGAEKQNAEQRLNEIMSKFNITDADLNDDAICHNEYFNLPEQNRFFFIQIMASVLGDGLTGFFSSKNKHYIAIDCTRVEFIEIIFRYEFYWPLYLEDLKIFNSAFFQKNELYANPERTSEKTISEFNIKHQSKIYKAEIMAMALKKHQVQKQIQSGNKIL